MTASSAKLSAALAYRKRIDVELTTTPHHTPSEYKLVARALGLDKDVARRLGLSPKDVSRLERGLFVHTSGFLSLLDQSLGGRSERDELLVRLWVGFATLVEAADVGDTSHTSALLAEARMHAQRLGEVESDAAETLQKASEEAHATQEALRDELAFARAEADQILCQKQHAQREWKQTRNLLEQERSAAEKKATVSAQELSQCREATTRERAASQAALQLARDEAAAMLAAERADASANEQRLRLQLEEACRGRDTARERVAKLESVLQEQRALARLLGQQLHEAEEDACMLKDVAADQQVALNRERASLKETRVEIERLLNELQKERDAKTRAARLAVRKAAEAASEAAARLENARTRAANDASMAAKEITALQCTLQQRDSGVRHLEARVADMQENNRRTIERLAKKSFALEIRRAQLGKVSAELRAECQHRLAAEKEQRSLQDQARLLESRWIEALSQVETEKRRGALEAERLRVGMHAVASKEETGRAQLEAERELARSSRALVSELRVGLKAVTEDLAMAEDESWPSWRQHMGGGG